jgi:hypothetical protein
VKARGWYKDKGSHKKDVSVEMVDVVVGDWGARMRLRSMLNRRESFSIEMGRDEVDALVRRLCIDRAQGPVSAPGESPIHTADRAPNEISVTFTGAPPTVRKQARAFGAALTVEDADRCTCGEPIDLELDVPQTVRYQNLRITGCAACRQTGDPMKRGKQVCAECGSTGWGEKCSRCGTYYK